MTTAELVASLAYKPGWSFRLGGPWNTYLCVFSTTPDSWHPSKPRRTQHQFALPDLEGRELIRWVFDRLLEVEQHEAAEFFTVGRLRPFYPNHQDEGSPYVLVERWDG